MRIAIIADDLTGALDVCAPLAARGLSCQVAVSSEGIGASLDAGCDVVCVNTASRELPRNEAMAAVQAAASLLAARKPHIAFKKIDSRLKGHVAAEAEICRAAFGRTAMVVAPAIPAQNRWVSDGAIRGAGIEVPIAIAERMGGKAEIPDTRSQADLGRVAAGNATTTLFVGASGLGEAFARLLGTAEPMPPLVPQAPFLFAIGSHDPITREQVERLRHAVGSDADKGAVGLCQALTTPDAPDHGLVMDRFAGALAEQLQAGRYAGALLCGGETAQTILGLLGVTNVRLLGSAAPGIPFIRAQIGSRSLDILTKSGGFGTPDALVRLCRAIGTAPHLDPNRTGEQA